MPLEMRNYMPVWPHASGWVSFKMSLTANLHPMSWRWTPLVRIVRFASLFGHARYVMQRS